MMRKGTIGAALLAAMAITVSSAAAEPGGNRTKQSIPSLSKLIRSRISAPEAEKEAKSAELIAAYKTAAPATVLIQTEHSLGSGFVLQAAVPGIVVTNHHVVADCPRTKDLRLEVTISTAVQQPNGSMKLVEKPMKARVLKWDPTRDLALLEIENPPAELPSLALSPAPPQVGEDVFAIGNGSVGMLWALKPAKVAAIGARQSMVRATAECAGENAKRERCREVTENGTRWLQTNAGLSHGDSGGPLLNMAGQVVGVNVAVSHEDVGEASLHIHLDELNALISEGVPGSAPAFATHPAQAWDDEDGGTFVDLDASGKPDVLAARMGELLLFDLDQDTFAPDRKVSANEVRAKGTLDAELAVLEDNGTRFAWYDTDNDGKYDLLVSAGREDGNELSAFSVAASGALIELPGDAGTELFQPGRFKTKSIGDRLAGLTSGTAKRHLPDPLVSTGREAEFADADEDNKADVIRLEGLMYWGLLLDPQQVRLPSVNVEEVGELLDGRTLGVSSALVFARDEEPFHVFFDLDPRAERGIAVKVVGKDRPIAVAAHRFVGQELGDAVPEHVGRYALRPEKLGGPRAAAILDKLGLAHATNEGAGSFPSWADEALQFDRWDTKVGNTVTLTGDGVSVLVSDLDGTGIPRTSKITEKYMRAAVEGGKFTPRFALVTVSGVGEWTMYDTNRDGTLDVVLFARDPEEGATIAWKVTATAATPLPSVVGGAMLRPSLYTGKSGLSTRSKRLFGEFFNQQFVE